MFRKWLRESFLTFGGLSVAILLLAGRFVGPLLASVQEWPPVAGLRSAIAFNVGVTVGIVSGVVIAFVAITVLGIVASRKEKDVATIGDIAAMLPRNRQEVVLGGLLSVNAGVVEELMFRLALPALIFGASGSSIAAVVGSLALFGALHLYQGVAGILGTAFVGSLMFLLYVVTGSIAAPIIAHALFDLRSLVLLPVTVFGAHKIDGRVQKFIPRPVPSRQAPERLPQGPPTSSGG